MTVLGTSQLVVDAIAARRAGVSRVVLPATGLGTATAHLQALYRLRPDVVHVNLCTLGGCDRTRGGADVARCSCRADQLPLRTRRLKLWRTRALSLRVDTRFGRRGFSTIDGRLHALGRGTVLSIPNCVPDIEGRPQTTDCATFRTARRR